MALEGVPAGDVAIFAICELFSLPFSFDAVERLRAHESWKNVILSATVALGLMLLGIVFPWIRKNLGIGVSVFLDRVVRNQRLWLITGLVVALYVALNGMLFLHQLRSDLDDYVMPRQITASQAQKLEAALAKHQTSAVTIQVIKNDQEASEYARQILDAMNKTGWDVNPPNHAGASMTDDYYLGLQIRVEYPGQPHPGDDPNTFPEAILRNAFTGADIPVDGGGGAYSRDKYELLLTVGHRPIPRRQMDIRTPLERLGIWIQRIGQPHNVP